MYKKVILQGKLEFGNERTYGKALDMYHHMLEVRFNQSMLIDEEFFNEETFELNVDRKVMQASPKYFRNTGQLVEYLVQLAISGTLNGWLLEDGQVLDHFSCEPSSEKAVVQWFRSGRDLCEEDGREEDAIELLNKALKRYDKHSQAYERRGYVNLKLGNTEDAIYDFEKSIRFDGRNAMAQLGLGYIYTNLKEYEKAIKWYDAATKSALALQPEYWTARRRKAVAHINLGQYDKAAFDLKLFTKRKFLPTDSNYAHREWAYSQYGMVLIKLGEYEQAIAALDEALAINKENKAKKDLAANYRHRGIAKHASGGSGYLSDWQEAAHLGDREAKKLLDTHVN